MVLRPVITHAQPHTPSAHNAESGQQPAGEQSAD
jgi:hypothetical protein